MISNIVLWLAYRGVKFGKLTVKFVIKLIIVIIVFTMMRSYVVEYERQHMEYKFKQQQEELL